MGSNVLNSRTSLKYSSNSVWKTKSSGGRRAAVTSRDRSERKENKSPKDVKTRGRADGEGRGEKATCFALRAELLVSLLWHRNNQTLGDGERGGIKQRLKYGLQWVMESEKGVTDPHLLGLCLVSTQPTYVQEALYTTATLAAAKHAHLTLSRAEGLRKCCGKTLCIVFSPSL